jgi:uncharacterized protein
VRIELDSVRASRKSFEHVYEPGELNLDDDRVQLLERPVISGAIDRSGNELGISGRLTTRVQVDCDRCLKPVVVPVETEFNLKYVTPAAYAAIETVELDERDLNLSTFDGAQIDIDEIVREQLLLAVPVRALCRENCQGLCPICGADKNERECDCQTEEGDPRWAALKELTDRKP